MPGTTASSPWRMSNGKNNFRRMINFFAPWPIICKVMRNQRTRFLLNIPQQAGILSYYYQGDLPDHGPTGLLSAEALPCETWLNTLIAKQHPHLYALFWADQAQDPTGQFERSLNEQLFKLDEQWFGNLRLVRYDVPEKAPTKAIEHPLTMALGEQIRFLGYDLAQGERLHLSLFWQAVKPVDKRYKVFVHLLDYVRRSWPKMTVSLAAAATRPMPGRWRKARTPPMPSFWIITPLCCRLIYQKANIAWKSACMTQPPACVWRCWMGNGSANPMMSNT